MLNHLRNNISCKWAKAVVVIGLLSMSVGQLAAQQACSSGGNQVTYGSGSWIGYVYDASVANARDFGTYKGYVTESENFDHNWGSNGTTGKTSCSNSADQYTIRYLMVKNYPAGTYTISHGKDDGTRVYVGTSAVTSVAGFASLAFQTNRWTATGTTTYTFEWAGGDMYLDFEFNEITGGAEAYFNICYNGPIQSYATGGTWNGYFYNATSPNDVNYTGAIASSYYNNNTTTNLNKASNSVSPVLVGAPSGATACYGTQNTNFSTRYLASANFARSFYLFNTSSDDGFRISSQGPATWNVSSVPTWNIVDHFGSGATGNVVTAVMDGATNLVAEHSQGTGPYLFTNTICQMAGDYTVATYPSWNAYAFNNSTIDFTKYAAWYKTTSSGATLIDNNFGTATPSNSIGGITGYTAGGCTGAPTLSANSFTARYVTRRNYTTPGIYVFNTLNNDDGRRLYIDYGSSGTLSLIFDNLSSGAGNTTSSPVFLSGSNDLYFDFRAGGTPNRANLNECLMGGGDLSAAGSNIWNVYSYQNASNAGYTTNAPSGFRKFFTSGSAGSNSVCLYLTDVDVANKGADCGQTICSGCNTQAINAKMNTTLAAGDYYIHFGSDDKSKLVISQGGSSVFNNTVTTSGTGTGTVVHLNGGSYDLEYWGDNSGGSGAIYTVSISPMLNYNAFGTFPTWNASAYNGNATYSDAAYIGEYTTTAANNATAGSNSYISQNFGTGAPSVTGSCRPLPTDQYSVRYRTNQTFPAGIYVFSNPSTDDGTGLTINAGSNNNANLGTYISGLNCPSCSAGSTSFSVPVSLNGTYSMIYDYGEKTGGAVATLQECMMGGGDLSAFGTGSWNVYSYYVNGYNNIGVSNYRKFFTSGTSSSTAANLSLTDVSVNAQGADCSLATCSGCTSQSIRAQLTKTFYAGYYSIAIGQDDNFKLTLTGGAGNLSYNGVGGIVSNNAFLNGTYDMVYLGDNSGGSGAIYSASITCLTPIGGTLTSSQTCNGSANTTLTLTGSRGYIQWQSSTDGITWTNFGSMTTSNTLAVSPSSTTQYRAQVISGFPTNANVLSNTALIVSGTVTGNMTVSSNTTLGGTINITGDFTVNAGVTVTEQDQCPLVINATNITINGTINADAAGYSGGNGGSGGYSANGTSCSNANNLARAAGSGGSGGAASGTGFGRAGSNGSIGNTQARTCNTNTVFGVGTCGSNTDGYNDGGPGGGGGSGGAYGGAGAAAKSGGNGWDRYSSGATPVGGSGGSASSAYGSIDLSTETISMGSGGGGGGAGGGGSYCGGDGGSGGDGGGSVLLNATNTLSVSGTITANGANGGNGGNGSTEQGGYNKCTINAGLGTCATTYDGTGGGGAGAGGGSGGGILLQALGPISVTGTLRANGGNGGNGGGAGNGNAQDGNGGAGGGGGRIKIAINPCQANNISGTITSTKGNGGGTTGNAGNDGTVKTDIINPSFTPLVAGAITSSPQTICNTSTLTDITASLPSGGIGTYSYQWYYTASGATATTGTNATPASGWSILPGASSQNLATASIAPVITGGGTYSFQRRDQSGSCYSWTTTLTITDNQPDAVTATGGPYCASGAVTVSTTQSSNVSYTLWNGTSAVGTSQNGNNGTLTFTTPTNTGTTDVIYQIQATKAGCTLIFGAGVTVHPLPIVYTITGGGHYCLNGAGVPVGLSSSDIGVEYQLVNAGNNIGSPVAGTGTAITFGNQTLAGTYTVTARNTATGCLSNTTSGGNIVIDPLPVINATNDGPYVVAQTIVLHATGGVSYIWSGPNGYTSTSANPNIVNCDINDNGDYIVTGTSPLGCVSSDTTNVYVGPNVSVWTGNAGTTDWFTAGNWSVAIPTQFISGVIPAGRPIYPVITGLVGQVAAAKNVIVQAGGTLSIQGVNNVNLEIYENLTNDGTAALGNGKIIMRGLIPQVISGTSAIKNLEIRNSLGVNITAGTGNMLYVGGIVTLTTGNLVTNGNLTLTSDASGAGMINDFSATTGSISGNITVQRYVANPSTGFYFIGSPVGNATISDWNSDFPNLPINFAVDGSQIIPHLCNNVGVEYYSPYAGLFDYRENKVSTCNLQGWHTRFSGAIPAGQGFAARIPNGTTIDLTGSCTTGNVTSPALTRSAGNATQSKGFNLIANPYPSPLDWLSVAAANSNVQGTAYTYITSGPMAGTYNAVNSITGTSLMGSSEAFWVEAKTNNATVSFNNNMRSIGNNQFLRTRPVYDQILTLTVSGNGHMDKARIAFGSNFTKAFDGDYDARKIKSDAGHASLYLNPDGDEYSIYAQTTPADVKQVPLWLEPGANGSFTIQASDINTFDLGQIITLEDKKLNTIQDLVKNDTYTFVADTNDAADRFVVHFAAKTDNSITTAETPFVNINGVGSDVNIAFHGFINPEVVSVNIYDLTGRKIIQTQQVATGNNRHVINMSNIVTGYYFVVLTGQDYEKADKVFLTSDK